MHHSEIIKSSVAISFAGLLASPAAYGGGGPAGPDRASAPLATRGPAAAVPRVIAPRAVVRRRLAAPAKARQIGVGIALGRDLSAGAWSREGGRAVWRLAVGSDGAQAVALALAGLQLPPGAALTWASADGRVTQGPYTGADVPAGGVFYTPMVPGAQGLLTLRLAGPDTAGSRLTVRDVQHIYAMVPATEGDGVARPKATAGACEIDVACPTGDTWRNELRATVLYSIVSSDNSQVFACSGGLLNTTANSEDPLLYTANHCTSGNQASSVVAYFNFQKATCNGAAMSLANWSQTESGAALVDAGTSADYALLRLAAPVPASYNAYFNAWNASTGASASYGAVMHHPSADVKKISTYSTAAARVAIPFSGSGTDQTWRVAYASGSTEEGSSGSSLLNQDRQVVGTLSGGAAGCDTTTPTQNNGMTDYYGRLDVAYPASSAIRAALDPVGNGTATSACAKNQGVAGCVASSTVPVPTSGTAPPATPTSSKKHGGALGWELLAGLLGLGRRRSRRAAPRHGLSSSVTRGPRAPR